MSLNKETKPTTPKYVLCKMGGKCYYYVSFQLGMPNHLLKSARTAFSLAYLLVFVLGMQITISFHHFFLNIGLFYDIFLCIAWKKMIPSIQII